MASRARSSLAALGVLGNSVRGLDFANWRKVYLAVILPILTYGSPIWFTDVKQKGLVQPLQVAQNQACRRLSGAFRTTPTAPLHHLLGIPPVRYTLLKLRSQYVTRLSLLPPSSPLITSVWTNPISRWHSTFLPLTNLWSLVKSRTPAPFPFSYPSPPYLSTWSHPGFTSFTSSKSELSATHSLILKPPPLTHFLYVRSLPLPTPDSYGHAFLLYSGERLLQLGVSVDTDRR
jgi:hypothetical protein